MQYKKTFTKWSTNNKLHAAMLKTYIIYKKKSCILFKEIISSHSETGIKIHFFVEVYRR